MRLNGHVVVKDLDIFDRVGHSTAHDEIVPFSIKRGKLSVHGEVSTFNGKLTVEFVKVRLDLYILDAFGWMTQKNLISIFVDFLFIFEQYFAGCVFVLFHWLV